MRYRRDLFSELSLVFFDTTTLYFEGAGGEDIVRRGHSKDHRGGDPQMVVGMVLDNQGNPVCQLWLVEAMFRTMKSVFETRPIYHHNDAGITGHVFCSFLPVVLRFLPYCVTALRRSEKPSTTLSRRP